MNSAVWNLAVFARRGGRKLHWRTLGLGKFNVTVEVRHVTTGRGDLEKELAHRFANVSAAALAGCRPAAAVDLVKVHLDLRFAQPDNFHLSGQAPLVVERLPEAVGGGQIAYSPLRPADFFVVDPGAELARQANRFFAIAWEGLRADDGPALLFHHHDRLQMVPARISWPELATQKANEPALIGAGRRERERVLETLAIDVSGELAADEERLEELPGRGTPLEERILGWLAAAPRPPLAFIGPAGCGKSSLIENVAARLLLRQGYLEHGTSDGELQVFRLAGRRLISGMSYVGQWEQRCLDLLEQCRSRNVTARRPGRRLGRQVGAPRERPAPLILWVDDLAAWGQIGKSRDSRRSLADVFLTPLQHGELLIFGEATPEAFALLEEDAPAFARLFRRVDLGRPDSGRVLSILLDRARRAEDGGAAPLAPSALRTLIETSPALYGEDAHPGFSSRLYQQAAEETPPSGGRTLEAADLLERMSRESGLPADLLRPDTPLPIEAVKAHFAARVYGQDEAVQVVAELAVTLKAGLGDPQRPHAVLLFTGPTGTGKTELAKVLAGWLYGDERRLLRFDMGEHGDSGAVARLVGDRGQPEGLLTEAIRAQPFSVLLFDEIEKADSEVLNLLLQVFEDGRLTDALGQVADFRQAVLVMTSNLGSSPNAKVGLRPDSQAQMIEARQAVERFFAPELWNRIDRIVAFRPLDGAIGRRIAETELYRIFSRRGLAERGVFVRADALVIDRIQMLGFDGKSGARGVKRFLEREVVAALSEALAVADPSAYMLFQLIAPPGGGFQVAVEGVREAAPLPADPAIDRLYELPPARLLAEIPEWVARLEAMHGEHDGLAREQSARLSAWRRDAAAGEAEDPGQRTAAADALHEIDFLRGRLAGLRQRLEAEAERRQPDEGELLEAALTYRIERRSAWDSQRVRTLDLRHLHAGGPPLAGEEMVALATEILWLEHAARLAGEGRGAGQVLIEIDLLSEHRPLARVRLADIPSLQQELAGLLLEDGLTLERFVAEEPAGAGASAAELATALAWRPRRLWLVASGPLAAERLGADVGCYVRVRIDGNQEIVRLVVHRLGPREPAAEERIARQAPAGPGGELRLLQRIHFEAPPKGEWVSCQVEDFGLCLAIERPVRRLAEVLQPLRRRRQLALLAAGAEGGA